ncbi:MAG: plasmid pRiA4b ORF-3 family protein [Kiloniellaceae bacterium]
MADSVIRLKVDLDDTDPPIWRRIEVPAATTLKDLHRIIQAAMGWEDAHLFAFEIGRQKAPSRVQLAELAALRIKRIGYLYDMGDNWQHTLRLEKTLAADPAVSCPRLLEGAGRCPPEDCGGIPGFYAFLEAIADPQHPDHDDCLDWYGGPFDPADMDVAQINQQLARIAARRKPKQLKGKL